MRKALGLMAAIALLGGAALAQSPDFDQNGSTDIFWTQLNVDSSMKAWLMSGINRLSEQVPVPDRPVHANWKVACLADFNQDNRADILWRNATSGKLVVWKMNGLTRETGFFIEPRPEDEAMISDLQWRIVACPDIGAMGSNETTPTPAPDSKNDIVWQHAVTRQIKIWYMTNFTENNSALTVPAAPVDPGWNVIAVREFGTSSGNSAPNDRVDLLFQNSTSKKIVVWFMDGNARQSGSFTSPDGPVDLNWDITGAGDFGTSSTNPVLDGKADIVFRNSTSGNVVVWFMNGMTRTEGVFTNPSGEADLDWVLIAPR